MVIILQFLTCEFHLLFYYSAPWYHKKILQVLTLILSFPVINKPISSKKWYYLAIQLFAYCLPTAWITQPQAQVLRNAIGPSPSNVRPLFHAFIHLLTKGPSLLSHDSLTCSGSFGEGTCQKFLKIMVYGSDQITLIYMLTDYSEMSIF